MEKIGGDGVAPTHIAPLIARRVELEKEMVLAIEKDGSVGIVDPVGWRAEMELRLPLGSWRGCGRSGRLLGRACSRGRDQGQRQEEGGEKMGAKNVMMVILNLHRHWRVALNH